MIRRIIQIDKEKCTGCGTCVAGCPVGCLELLSVKQA